jgi:hypothetical protein
MRRTVIFSRALRGWMRERLSTFARKASSLSPS